MSTQTFTQQVQKRQQQTGVCAIAMQPAQQAPQEQRVILKSQPGLVSTSDAGVVQRVTDDAAGDHQHQTQKRQRTQVAPRVVAWRKGVIEDCCADFIRIAQAACEPGHSLVPPAQSPVKTKPPLPVKKSTISTWPGARSTRFSRVKLIASSGPSASRALNWCVPAGMASLR